MVLAALQHLALLWEVKRNGNIRAAKEKVGGVRGVSSFLRLAHQTVFLFSKLEVEHASESAAKARIPCLLKMYGTTDHLMGCALPPCKATAPRGFSGSRVLCRAQEGLCGVLRVLLSAQHWHRSQPTTARLWTAFGM